MMLDRLEGIIDQHEVTIERLAYLKSLVRLTPTINEVIEANALITLIWQDIDDIVEAIFA